MKRLLFLCCAYILISGTFAFANDKIAALLTHKTYPVSCQFSQVISPSIFDCSLNKTLKQDSIITDKRNINYLALFGEVWGFLKYHHSIIAVGKFDMDAQLLKILPAVVNAPDNDSLSQVLETWVDGFGIPEKCQKCQLRTDNEVVQYPDYADLFNNNVFQTSLKNKLQYILDNHNKGSNYYVKSTPVAGNPIFTNEQADGDSLYPAVGLRLLSLFRYWNMVQYFYPYKNLIGTSWNSTLVKFIPRFINAPDKTTYALTALAMVCNLHDSHAIIGSSNTVLENYRGLNISPAQAKFIENKLVVTGYYLDTLNIKEQLKPGDIIKSINGITVDSLVKKYRPITPGSNEAVVLRNMPGSYLLRTNDNVIKFEIIRDNKNKAGLFRTVNYAKINRSIEYAYDPAAPAYTLLDENIGYIFAGKYKNQDLPKIKELIQKTKGLIIDLRGGPSDNISFTLAPYLKSGPAETIKLVTGSVNNPGMFTSAMQEPSARNLGKYKGKVIVLVNEMTQSFGEYSTMVLQGSPNVMVIGSTTAGADGDVSKISLPGKINTYMSGVGILYPDGSQTQRKGVKIDQLIRPTIAGVKAGRDEVLEKAKKLITDQ